MNDYGCFDVADNSEADDPPPTCFPPLEDQSCQQIGRRNFGGYLIDRRPSPDLRGVRSNISVPNHWSLPYITAAVMRVSAESLGRLMQVGYGRTLRMRVRCCGSTPADGKLYYFWEALLPDGSADGAWLRSKGPVPLNASQLFTVHNRSGANTGGLLTLWIANINGENQIPNGGDRNVGFSGARLGLASGEIVSDAGGSFDRADGNVEACFGCSSSPKGSIRWQWTRYAGSTGWADITAAQAVRITDGPGSPSTDRWTLGPVGPSGFIVKHVCDGQHGC